MGPRYSVNPVAAKFTLNLFDEKTANTGATPGDVYTDWSASASSTVRLTFSYDVTYGVRGAGSTLGYAGLPPTGIQGLTDGTFNGIAGVKPAAALHADGNALRLRQVSDVTTCGTMRILVR
jgi:hypothetical protein